MAQKNDKVKRDLVQIRRDTFLDAPLPITLQLAKIFAKHYPNIGLNSVIRASHVSHVSHEKHENYANSAPQENSLPCQWLSAKPRAVFSASQFELFRHYCPIRS